MEIRGDLRDTVDDLIEHNEVCVADSPIQCDRCEMHIREIVSFIKDQPHKVKYQLHIILREASERGWS